MAKIVSVINFKGGVGKTSLVFHLATGLVKYHDAKVLLIDTDHQSSLSVICLGGTKWKTAVDSKQTLDQIFQHFVGDNKPLPGKEIIIKTPLGRIYSGLDIISGALQLDETELDLSSTTKGSAVKSEWRKRTLICEWLEATRCDKDYDYILFDCPPATKLITQNAIAASHGFVLPVIPDSVSTRGIPHLTEKVFKKIDRKMMGLANYLKSEGNTLPASYIKNTSLIGIVISMIKEHGPALSGYINEHTENLDALTKKYRKSIIKPYVPFGAGVPECLSSGKPVYDRDSWANVANRNYVPTFKRLTARLKKAIDSA